MDRTRAGAPHLTACKHAAAFPSRAPQHAISVFVGILLVDNPEHVDQEQDE
jgi:hypothetical protein